MQAEDILVTEAEPDTPSAALAPLGLRLEDERRDSTVNDRHSAIGGAALSLVTAAVPFDTGVLAFMTLSDFMNNAATAAVMCPVAAGAASQLGVSADPFSMAVAVGASCAFLTPIGHQKSTLILGPGGFRLGDYWPLGLPLQILVVLVAMPTPVLFWPL